MGRPFVRYELVRERTLGEARKLDRATKTFGKKGGVLGRPAMEILEFMWSVGVSDAEAEAAELAWMEAAPPGFHDQTNSDPASQAHWDERPPHSSWCEGLDGPVTARVLADRLGAGEGTCNLAFKRLEQHGFVRRSK